MSTPCFFFYVLFAEKAFSYVGKWKSEEASKYDVVATVSSDGTMLAFMKICWALYKG